MGGTQRCRKLNNDIPYPPQRYLSNLTKTITKFCTSERVKFNIDALLSKNTKLISDKDFSKLNRWHNGRAFVFCEGDCLFNPDRQLAAMLAIKVLAGVAPEVDLRECTLHWSPQKQVGCI